MGEDFHEGVRGRGHGRGLEAVASASELRCLSMNAVMEDFRGCP